MASSSGYPHGGYYAHSYAPAQNSSPSGPPAYRNNNGSAAVEDSFEYRDHEDHGDGSPRRNSRRTTYGYADGGEEWDDQDLYDQQAIDQRAADDQPFDNYYSSKAAATPATNYSMATPATMTRGGGNGRFAGGGSSMAAADTPSVYTNDFEWQSHHQQTPNLFSPNVVAGDDNFLDSDPYSRGGDFQRQSQLLRNNTLQPGDSVSAYEVPIPTPGVRGSAYSRAPIDPLAYGGGVYGDGDDSMTQGYQTYNNIAGSSAGNGAAASRGPYGHHAGQASMGQSLYDSSASGFLKGNAAPMGYADDEDDEHRQLKDPSGSAYYYNDGQHLPLGAAPGTPGLLSNQMSMAGGGPPGNGLRSSGKSVFDDEDTAVTSYPLRGLFGFTKDSLEVQIEKRRRGIGRQRWPILTWVLSIAFVAVFIVQLIKAKQVTGQAIQTHPSINPMIGPSAEFQISFGARFVPCMRTVPAVPTTLLLPCLNASTLSTVTTSQECPLWDLCGLDNAADVGQAYRFVTPIFLHAGIVHILFNLLVQLTLCAQIEKIIGAPYYLVLYIAGGIGGNLLGGNFGLVGLPSVGASGSIYACIAVEVVDLIYNWKYEYRVKLRIFTSILFTLIGLGVGLLPGLDNWTHIGGLAVGTLCGMMLLPSIHTTRRHRLIVWFFRLVGAAVLVVYFVMLTLNFYGAEDPAKACTWCRYFSCLPTFTQCQNNGLGTASSSSRRSLWEL
jgi:membrane associated rhomboid family serine protease